MYTYLLLTSVVHIDVDDNALCDQSPVDEGVDRVVRKGDASQEVLVTREEEVSSRDNHWRGRSLGRNQEEEEHAFQEFSCFFGLSQLRRPGQSTGQEKPRTGRERGEITTK